MLSDLRANAMWNEPLVGALFGEFYLAQDAERRAAGFILASEHRTAWLGGIRAMVLSGAAARFPALPRSASLVVKEPNGALGAPLLSAALPESRVVFMLRDPRDVIASVLDAQRAGGWTTELPWDVREEVTLADTDPEMLVRETSERYMQAIARVKQSYQLHRGPKVLVRYEDLRMDPRGVLRQTCAALEMGVRAEELTRVVENRAWERIPGELKGERKIFRKATPGAWVDDLTAEQASIVQQVTEPVLAEFYADAR